MLFGQSVFQSVLTRLKDERSDEAEEESRASFRIKGLGVSFVAPTDDRPMAADTDAYFAFLPELIEMAAKPLFEPEAPLPIPPHLLRLTPEDIREELAITPKDTEASLAEKRRHFAKANHPDGVAPEFRENANTRMKIANLLIDTAIADALLRR